MSPRGRLVTPPRRQAHEGSGDARGQIPGQAIAIQQVDCGRDGRSWPPEQAVLQHPLHHNLASISSKTIMTMDGTDGTNDAHRTCAANPGQLDRCPGFRGSGLSAPGRSWWPYEWRTHPWP